MNLIFKNKSQMLKGLQVGDTIIIDNRLKDTYREATVKEIRSNSLILTSEEQPHTHLDLQTASTMKFDSNGIISFKAFMKQTRYGSSLINPSPDFEVGDTWLTVRFVRGDLNG